MTKLLDCGHEPTPQKEGALGTGYGTGSDGKTRCYQCCADKERADMIATGRATLYFLSSYGGPTGQPARVTDWSGVLSFRVREYRKSRHGGGFGSQRTDAWFAGPDGYVWHAINRGDMQIARCRRTKEKIK